MAISLKKEILTEAAILEQVSLLGRKTELRQLIKALTLCRSGQGKAVLLVGNEGVGKTALLNTFTDLAQRYYCSQAVRITLPYQVTFRTFFVKTLEELLTLSHQRLQDVLAMANDILHRFGLHWDQNDLVRIVALTRMQESIGSRSILAVDQLAQIIRGAVPAFRRNSPEIQDDLKQLAEILCDPWVTLAVSLINPINSQIQSALALMDTITGKHNRHLDVPLLSTQAALDEPPKIAEDPGEDSAPFESESTELMAETKHDAEDEETREQPELVELQTALSDLLVLINNFLRSHQAALILTFDQWELVSHCTEADRKAINDCLSEVLRKTVEQRDFRLMVMIACRSESESYAFQNNLYNALRQKVLVSTLPGSVQHKFLKERFKSVSITLEDQVNQDIQRICQGNPAWLKLMSEVIESESQAANMTLLDWDTYQERFAVNQPQALIDILYTRLQLHFMGEESLFLTVLGKFITQFAYQTFSLDQMRSFAKELPELEAHPDWIRQLLEALVQHRFVQETAGGLSSHSPMYQFCHPFLLTFLMTKTRPIQEDIPAPDKIASLKKVLPLSIQSGELTKEKTQEILSMASALENPELIQFVEHSLIESLEQTEQSLQQKLSLLESLSMLNTPPAIDAMLKLLSAPETEIREYICQQMVLLSSRNHHPGIKENIIASAMSLIKDEVLSIRCQAYQMLALSNGMAPEMMAILFDGLRNSDPSIRVIALSGLERRQLKTPEMLKLYQDLLEEESDLQLQKIALKGLQTFDRSKVTAILSDYLEYHSQAPIWSDVLAVLMNLDFGAALPWISTLFAESEDLTLKLQVTKRLGSRPGPDAERILIRLLSGPSGETLAPELRWMAIRSLGWIGCTQEALLTLEAQASYCFKDEILMQSLQKALNRIQERVNGYLAQPSLPENPTLHHRDIDVLNLYGSEDSEDEPSELMESAEEELEAIGQD